MWKEFHFKDISLSEIFQDNFEGFTKEDFKLGSIYHLYKLWDSLQKFGVWIQKQLRYTISRSLYNMLLEEEPTK